MAFTILQNLFEMVHSHMFNIFVKVLYCEKFIPLIFLQWTEANMSIQVQILNKATQIYGYHDLPERTETDQNGLKRTGTDLRIYRNGSEQTSDFIDKHYCKMAWNTENSMKEYLTTFSWVFWVLLLFITMFIDWIIKCFSEVKKTNDIYIFGKKHIVFVDKSH